MTATLPSSRPRLPSRRIVAITVRPFSGFGERVVDLCRKQAEACHRRRVFSVDRRKAPGLLGRCARDADAARADELLNAVRAGELLEGIELLRRSGQLERHGVGTEVDDAPFERL